MRGPEKKTTGNQHHGRTNLIWIKKYLRWESGFISRTIFFCLNLSLSPLLTLARTWIKEKTAERHESITKYSHKVNAPKNIRLYRTSEWMQIPWYPNWLKKCYYFIVLSLLPVCNTRTSLQFCNFNLKINNQAYIIKNTQPSTWYGPTEDSHQHYQDS